VTVGDLVEPVSRFRARHRGVGIVVAVTKSKFESSVVEVVFPNSTLKVDERYRKKTLYFGIKELRLVSESRRSSQTEA
jgi:hypothetical protein